MVRGQRTRVHLPRRYIPMILVPGVMGSRLTDPLSDELVFNPLGWPVGMAMSDPGDFAVNVDRLTQVSAELVPDTTHPYTDEQRHRAVQHIRYYYNILPSFYGEVAERLASLKIEMAGVTVIPRVYCCGYDWRQDNAKSALRLAAVVEEALRETGEKQVLIFCHSMGGLVTRYYSRVLGGESKIFQLFLLASPTLGTAGGYAQLKDGLFGFSTVETIRNFMKGNVRAGLTEIAGAVANVPTLVENASVAMAHIGKDGKAAGAGAAIKPLITGFFGDLATIFSLGAGRTLTRAETTYILRQMPSAYQLMPNAVLCDSLRHWLTFDPLATGYPPTGFMLKLPTLLDTSLAASIAIGTEIAKLFTTQAQKAGDMAKKTIADELSRGYFSERSGRRARRNVETLVERVLAIVAALNQMGKVTAASDADAAAAKFGKLTDASSLLAGLVQRIQRCFVDCRDARTLYNDIYTGMLDAPQLRALGAANVAQALAFHDALTVHARPPAHVPPLDIIRALLDAMNIPESAPRAGDFVLANLFTVIINGKQELKKREAFARKLAAENKRHKPKAYMHPRTFNAYCDDLLTPSSCVLIPSNVVSLDDHNVVTGEFSLRTGHGDGTVMVESGNPSAALLSHPFIESLRVSKAAHTEVPNHHDTLKTIAARVTALAPDFFRNAH